jgi:hypothetical protein
MESQREKHITQSLLYRWELGRTVEKYSKHMESQKSSTSLNPCFIGGNGWTVEK